MLHWLHKKLMLNNQHFLCGVFAACGLHCLFCIFFFFTFDKAPIFVAIKKFPSHTRVICVPCIVPMAIKEKSQAKYFEHKKNSNSNKSNKIEKKKKNKEVEKKQPPLARKKIIDQSKKQLPEKIDQPDEHHEKSKAIDTTKQADESIIYVHKNTAQALALFEEIQKSIMRFWIPPIGIVRSLSCELKIELMKNGKIKNVFTIKKSGVPLYDIAAKKAVIKAYFPQSVWGKSIIIHFGGDQTV